MTKGELDALIDQIEREGSRDRGWVMVAQALRAMQMPASIAPPPPPAKPPAAAPPPPTPPKAA